MSANRALAKAKAKEIRERYGIRESPVNLFDIAPNEGIEIIYFTPDDTTKNISGLLDKEKKTIFLNVHDSAARQNFTLAHELAHYFLDHKPDEYGVYRRDSLYAESKPEKEQEADYFAAELLMPQELIERAKAQYGLSDNDPQALARLFGVSTSAMRYRLRDLNGGRASG
jgi:Zn-dependent peptidase ImmA (M78 family)